MASPALGAQHFEGANDHTGYPDRDVKGDSDKKSWGGRRNGNPGNNRNAIDILSASPRNSVLEQSTAVPSVSESEKPVRFIVLSVVAVQNGL